MKPTYRKLIDQVTPTRVIRVGDVNIHVYPRGNQVVAVLFLHEAEVFTSSGYGYCKASHVIDQALRRLGKRPAGSSDGNPLPQKYRVGGNFWRVPKSSLRNF